MGNFAVDAETMVTAMLSMLELSLLVFDDTEVGLVGLLRSVLFFGDFGAIIMVVVSTGGVVWPNVEVL